MSKFIAPLAFLLGSIGIIVWLIVPSWQHFFLVRADSKYLQDINAEIDVLTQKRDALNQQIAAISKDNLDRLDQMVPSGAQGPEFLAFLEQLGQTHGMSVTKLDLSGVLSTKGRVVEKKSGNSSMMVSGMSNSNTQGAGANVLSGNANKPNATNVGKGSTGSTGKKVPTYQTISVTMEVTGPYDRFKDFLRELESSARITDVQSLAFSPGKFSPGKNDSSFNFSFVLKAYYQ